MLNFKTRRARKYDPFRRTVVQMKNDDDSNGARDSNNVEKSAGDSEGEAIFVSIYHRRGFEYDINSVRYAKA